MLKNTAFALFFILIVGNVAHLGGPWWSVVLVSALALLLFPMGPARALAVGTVAGTMLWWLNALWIHLANGEGLAGKIGQVFQGLQGLHLLAAAALLGGLLGGMGALTGTYARTLFAPPNQGRRRRRR